MTVTIDHSQARSDDKLTELMLYVSQKCESDGRFGATKLNKILFFADFLSYLENGEPITGQAYQRLDQGPAPRRLVPVRNDLVARGHAAIQARRVMNYTRQRLIALRDPNLDLFSGRDIEVVDRVIGFLRDKNATQASDISHKFLGWKLATDGEDIPYETVLVSDRTLSEAEVEAGQQLEKDLGL